jgi:hypothetical protein
MSGAPVLPTFRSAATRFSASCRFAFQDFVNGSPDGHAEGQTCGIISMEVCDREARGYCLRAARRAWAVAASLLLG